MLIEKPKVFISPEFLIRQASQSWERVGSSELRHRTFVEEQGIFTYHDRDEIDNVMMPVVAISTLLRKPTKWLERFEFIKRKREFGGVLAYRLP